MTEKLLKSTCPACGAPVSRKDRQHGFVCPYCGTEFYAEAAPNASVSNQFSQPQVGYDTAGKTSTADNSAQKKKTNSIWSYLILVVFFLIFITAPRWLTLIPMFTDPPFPGIDNEPGMFLDFPSSELAAELFTSTEFEISSDANFRIENDLLFFDFTFQNWGDQTFILHYQANTFEVYDDLGNDYPINLGSCNADSANEDRQIEIKPNEKVEFTSSSSWCNSVNSIPAFSGVIPSEAKQIYFHIKEFGEFKDITFSFDL